MNAAPRARWFLRLRVVLGVAGLALTIPAIPIVLSLGTGGPLDPIGSQARSLSRSLDQVSSALTRVESSLTAAGATLDEAQITAANAAQMTDALGGAMADMATASQVEVLGVQPFGTLTPRFSEIATRASAVATSLRSMRTSLGASGRDLVALTDEVTALAATAQRLAGGKGEGIGGGALAASRVLLALLLAWMAAMALLLASEAFGALRAGPADRGVAGR